MNQTLSDVAFRLKQAKAGNIKIPRAVVMSDIHRLPDPAFLLTRRFRGGTVIIRHPNKKGREVLARNLIPLCRRNGIKVLIAGDAKMAWRLRADGVHLSEDLARKGPAVLWPRRKNMIVTAAAHSLAATFHSQRAGAQAVLVSPVFPTKSHPHKKVLGPVLFGRIVRFSPLKCIALGGIDRLQARRIQPFPLAGFAAIDGWSS